MSATGRTTAFRFSSKDGTFVKEIFVAKDTKLQGSMWWLALWPDANQSYLINADGANNEVRVLKRDTGEVVGSFGRSGRNAGQFHWVHNLAIDSKGNIYTTEVDNAKARAEIPLYRTAAALSVISPARPAAGAPWRLRSPRGCCRRRLSRS